MPNKNLSALKISLKLMKLVNIYQLKIHNFNQLKIFGNRLFEKY